MVILVTILPLNHWDETRRFESGLIYQVYESVFLKQRRKAHRQIVQVRRCD